MVEMSQTPRSLLRKTLLAGLLMALVILLITLVRSGFFQTSNAPASAQSEKSATSAGRDEVVLACPGRVEGLTEVVDVGAGIEGVLTEVRVKEGQPVATGDVLAVVACGDLKAELQTAQAEAEAARQTRQRLLHGSRAEERRMAAHEVEVAQAILHQAQLQHQRITGLFDKGDVSRESLETARRDMEVAEASLRAKTEHQQLVNAPPLPEELAKADAEVKAAEERISAATAKLDKCIVRAPIKGVVLRRHLDAGEVVSVFNPRPIVSLADISRLRVRAEVDERDLGRIFPGQSVLVMADAFPDKKLPGHVSRISPMMGRKKVQTGDPTEKSNRDVLEVLADLETTDQRAVVGLRITVQFLGSGNIR